MRQRFFTTEETDKILTAGTKYGLRPKIHASELDYSGGIQIGVKHNALSVDHLEYVGDEEIKVLKKSETMPTILPGAAFFLNMPYSPARKMIDAGLSYIPEERMHDGAIKEFSVAENLILQDHIRTPFSNGIFLDFRHISKHARQMISDFNVKTPSQETLIKNLSGGNIQKLILARELSRKPRVLIAAQPTRGVDIGATEYIHAQLLQQRSEGLATLLISEDLDEVRALSDRIVVMFGGEVMGIVNNDETTIEELGLMMAGERVQASA